MLNIYLNDIRSLSNQGLEIAGKPSLPLKPNFEERNGVFGGHLPLEEEARLESVKNIKLFKRADRNVHMLLALADGLKDKLQHKNCGIQACSSRGASISWEHEHQQFLNTGYTSASSSPVTTLGNLGSNLAQYLKPHGAISENSITCSSAGMSLMNGIAWLKAGFNHQVLIASSEACLSPFTQAQMNALGVASKFRDQFPCKALDMDKSQNSMVLGEAAASLIISQEPDQAKAVIKGIGWSSGSLTHPGSMDPEGKALQQSMKMALSQAEVETVDLVFAHAPGTLLGDKAELFAIQNTLDKDVPIFSNKAFYGHTFASSFLLSLMSFLGDLSNFQHAPGLNNSSFKRLKKDKTCLINCIGFGAQAFSIVLEKA